MSQSDFESPLVPREIADAPDVENVPVADWMHTLSQTVMEMHYELRQIGERLGVPAEDDESAGLYPAVEGNGECGAYDEETSALCGEPAGPHAEHHDRIERVMWLNTAHAARPAAPSAPATPAAGARTSEGATGAPGGAGEVGLGDAIRAEANENFIGKVPRIVALAKRADALERARDVAVRDFRNVGSANVVLAAQVEQVRALVLPLADGGPTDDEPLTVGQVRAALDGAR
jgi:hypothetical protein